MKIIILLFGFAYVAKTYENSESWQKINFESVQSLDVK